MFSLCPIVLIFPANIGIFSLNMNTLFWWNLEEVITIPDGWTDYILSEIVPGTWEQENSNWYQTDDATLWLT